MRRPICWHLFQDRCDLAKYLNCNLYAPEKRNRCRRGNRPEYDTLLCHWNSCPKLKEIRRKVRKGELKEPVDLNLKVGMI